MRKSGRPLAETGYSFLSRVLHRVALGSDAVAEASFDIDRKAFPADAAAVAEKRHIFVSGLARAGTTILMRELYATSAFRSLTYRDMPFVLAPNLWGKITRSSHKDMAAAERAHGDGILVDFDSPEALDEVFWRVHCGDQYIKDDRLKPMSADADVRSDFRDYVAMMLRGHAAERYLSKNNNNILRLGSVLASLPNAVAIIPFREPLQHAYSLLRQHKSFLEQQATDRFALSYMNWLAHHEFGQGHRPFGFGKAAEAGFQRPDDPASLAYWLFIWLDAYSYLQETAGDRCLFLSYEQLCAPESSVWARLCEALDLSAKAPETPFKASRPDIPLDAPDDLQAACDALYQDLSARAFGA